MDIFGRLCSLGVGLKVGRKPNQNAARAVDLTFTKKDVATFNKVYRLLLGSDMNIITRTPSGGVEITRQNLYAWDCYSNNCGLRVTAICDGYMFVWRLGRPKFNQTDMKGWRAWRIFVNLCEKEGIDLKNMAIDNGAEVKSTIQKPYIRMLIVHQTLENVHHIDFHSSYGSGLALTHPEFRPVIEKMYNERKTNPVYKDVLVCIIGYMQSIGRCKAAWAHLAKDAIDNNNTRMEALMYELELTGRRIVGLNTDGIWYQGDIYHDARNGEGPGIGQWHNDHTNCLFRARSDGAYEFIERGVYHPVVRGLTRLDLVKERDTWEWGDIYDKGADVMRFKFIEGEGVYLMED